MSSTATNTALQTPADEASVKFESAYSTRTFILNKPKVLNALDWGMIESLLPRINEWNNSELCKIIIGRGEGRALCAGGEVKSVVQNAADPKTRNKSLAYFKSEFQLDYNLATLSKPYVSIMDGITFGGGVGLSAYAPFRIATPRTLFAMPESKIGYSPDVGMTYVLARLDGEIGTYLALTGNTLTGAETFRLGLATHYVEESRIPVLLERLGGLEAPDKSKINATLEEFSEDVDADRLGTKDGAPPSVLKGEIRSTLDDVFSRKSVEEIFKALESLAESNSKTSNAVRDWSKETLETLHLRSPTSLKVALRAVRTAYGEGFRLSDSFQMELGIATAFCSGGSPDMITGVTSLLIEKSKGRPDWKPATVAEVDDQWVEDTFFHSHNSEYVKNAPRIQIGDRDMHLDLNSYALPSERQIRSSIIGDAKDSGSGALNFDELFIKWNRRKLEKKGIRAKLQEIVDRRCEVQAGGWLKWKKY